MKGFDNFLVNEFKPGHLCKHIIQWMHFRFRQQGRCDAFETKYGIEPSYIVCKVVTKYIFII